MQNRPVLFLLDGLNEMPHRDADDFTQLIRRWKAAISTLAESNSHMRMIISCRRLDYSAPLSSDHLPIPQVQVDDLDNERVHQFLRMRMPRRGSRIFEALQAEGALDLFRIPYLLELLVRQVRSEGDLPSNRAAPFTGFVRQVLQRELQQDNRTFDDPQLLHPRDRLRLVQGLLHFLARGISSTGCPH